MYYIQNKEEETTERIIKMNIKNAFTLAEIISVVAILGIVSTITMTSVTNNVRKRIFATSAKKTYAALQSATEIWQIENNCVDNIETCISSFKKSPDAFEGIAKNLAIIASTNYSYQDNLKNCDKNDKECINRSINLDWLPERTTLYNGKLQDYPWQGVSKYATGENINGGDDNITGLYLLKDGTTLSVQLPDDFKKSGFGFFDVNGKKGPNKVGVDVYPFGFGIPYQNAEQKAANELNYGGYARNFNPYYVEDNGWSGYGMCAVRNGNSYTSCSNEDKKNPTIWLLKNSKVPNT